MGIELCVRVWYVRQYITVHTSRRLQWRAGYVLLVHMNVEKLEREKKQAAPRYARCGSRATAKEVSGEQRKSCGRRYLQGSRRPREVSPSTDESKLPSHALMLAHHSPAASSELRHVADAFPVFSTILCPYARTRPVAGCPFDALHCTAGCCCCCCCTVVRLGRDVPTDTPAQLSDHVGAHVDEVVGRGGVALVLGEDLDFGVGDGGDVGVVVFEPAAGVGRRWKRCGG